MPMGPVDLRSDTVTRPTPAMRRAMADAEVGDDGFGEDPTVRALEAAYAERVGKQAGLFVPSGTMANQVCLRTLGVPGSVVIAGRSSHVVRYEAGAAGVNVGVQFQTVDDADGRIDPADVAEAVAFGVLHGPSPSLVCVENTHNAAGGVPWDLDALQAVAACGVPLHLDGARLFNAEVATGTPAAAFAAPATTTFTALTKGLAAPVGSVVAGPVDVIAEARAHRKRLGGAMRQAGVLAAAGLVALRDMVERLADDHARARRLAEVVAERWPGAVDPATVRTNMVIWPHPDPPAVLAHLRAAGVLALETAPGRLRLVTHLDVDDAGIERAVAALATAP
jgi:threonine aldolase